MTLQTRKILDASLTALGLFSFFVMAGALLIILVPLVMKGTNAFVFRETVERREFMLEHPDFQRGNPAAVRTEIRAAEDAREPVYAALREYESGLGFADFDKKQKLEEIKEMVRGILGPLPGDEADY